MVVTPASTGVRHLHVLSKMKIEILPSPVEEKPLFRRMLELYAYDWSGFEDTDLNEFGEYGYDYLDVYWTESDRHPFIVRVDGKLAGFVFVNRIRWVESSDHSLAEFFILRKYRRKGIGMHVALNVFERFPGAWEVKTQRKNRKAITFWRKVVQQGGLLDVEEFTDGVSDWEGLLWTFTNKRKEPDGALNRMG